MKLFDWLQNKPNLFNELSEQMNGEFFNGVDFNTILSTMKYLYGDRVVTEKVENMSSKEIADMVILVYSDKWKKSYQLLHDEMEIGVSSKNITTEKNNREDTRNMNREDESSVTAYNEVGEYYPEDKKDETVLDENTSNSESEKNNTTKSIWAVQQQLSMFRNSFIKDYVIKDTVNLITYEIY